MVLAKQVRSKENNYLGPKDFSSRDAKFDECINFDETLFDTIHQNLIQN